MDKIQEDFVFSNMHLENGDEEFEGIKILYNESRMCIGGYLVTGKKTKRKDNNCLVERKINHYWAPADLYAHVSHSYLRPYAREDKAIHIRSGGEDFWVCKLIIGSKFVVGYRIYKEYQSSGAFIRIADCDEFELQQILK